MRSMQKRPSIWKMAVRAVWDGGPGLCHFAITSACNARCGFCSFARDQLPAASRHSVTLDEAKFASDILTRNGVRFLHFTGGEPLVHRDFPAMVAHAAQIGMVPTLVTNGALLTPKRVDLLADAGLATVYISIDAASHAVHDSNRGLPGLSARIRRANAALARRQIPSSASVTMSRLVDYLALPEFLRDLGFGGVTFSYPLRTLPSSYLACAESPLVDFAPQELHTAFEAVKALSREFPVLGPVASIEDMQRHLRGEPEMFGCLAGWKFFLFGLAPAALALSQLGPAAVRHPRLRRNSACARRLHRLHDRLLSRRFGHAACRHGNERRFAGGGARRFSASLETLDRQPKCGFCTGRNSNGKGLDGRRRQTAQAADSASAGIAGAGRERRMISFSASMTRKKTSPPRNNHGQIHSGIASVSKRVSNGGA